MGFRLLQRHRRVVARSRRLVDLLRGDITLGQQRDQPVERLLGEREVFPRATDLLVGDSRVGAFAGEVAAALVDFRLRGVDLGLGEIDAQFIGRRVDGEQHVAPLDRRVVGDADCDDAAGRARRDMDDWRIDLGRVGARRAIDRDGDREDLRRRADHGEAGDDQGGDAPRFRAHAGAPA